jgi:hypothetical protein
MTAPISICLHPAVRETLALDARSRGIGLTTGLRALAGHAARDVRRSRIRAESDRVGQHIGSDPEVKQFMADWGGRGRSMTA